MRFKEETVDAQGRSGSCQGLDHGPISTRLATCATGLLN
jgi:hypothetical protein